MQKYGSVWSHDETILALGLYFQMPFGKIHSRSFEVRRLAKLMNRYPASLSMKMCDFYRLFHQVRGAADCIAGTWPSIRSFPFLSS